MSDGPGGEVLKAIQEIPKRPCDLRMLQHTLYEAKKPFISMKADILNISLPNITIFPDGHCESRYSDDIEAYLAKIDAAWEEEAAWIMKRYGYEAKDSQDS